VNDIPLQAIGGVTAVGDPADPRLADYVDLADPGSRRRVERERSVMMAEGRIAVGQLLSSDHRMRSLLVDDHQVHSARALVEATLAGGVPVYVGSREVVAETVGFALHRGVVAAADRPVARDPEQVLALAARTPSIGGGPPLLAVLEGLNDHENVGALFRNAAAFGVAAVLLDPTCADPLYRRSIRVSAGHVLRVPFARLTPWPGAMDRLRAAGFLVAALAPRRMGHDDTGHVVSLEQLRALVADGGLPDGAGPADRRFTGVALVVGAEGPGLTPLLLAAADQTVSIPMAEGVDSLNAATAAAIAFHRLSGG
jgi:tRNA G18 (ribose-2'-O)-methylase SpoU